MTTKIYKLKDLEQLPKNGFGYRDYYRIPEPICGSDLIKDEYSESDDETRFYLVYPDRNVLVYQEEHHGRGGSGNIEINFNDDGSVIEEVMWS